MSGIPWNRQRRYWMNRHGDVFENSRVSGRCLLPVSALFAPSPEATRQTILRLRRQCLLSRGQLAVCLGVGLQTLRSWEAGQRKPCVAARRLVQLIEQILFSPESIHREFGLLLIGRVDQEAVEEIRKHLAALGLKPGKPDQENAKASPAATQ